jgi:hypothetical protein
MKSTIREQLVNRLEKAGFWRQTEYGDLPQIWKNIKGFEVTIFARKFEVYNVSTSLVRRYRLSRSNVMRARITRTSLVGRRMEPKHDYVMPFASAIVVRELFKNDVHWVMVEGIFVPRAQLKLSRKDKRVHNVVKLFSGRPVVADPELIPKALRCNT